MRISKLPIPLIIAAAALTGVAVIYVYLTAPPMPIHTDPNFTSPLFSNMVYLWRGAAFQYVLSADRTISVAYGPAYPLIYTTGPLTNITLGQQRYIVYPFGERPLYVERRMLMTQTGGTQRFTYYLVYKLEDVTPPNSSIPNLYMWLPKTFGPTEFLSQREVRAIEVVAGAVVSRYRVLNVVVNGTHIIYRIATVTRDYYMEFDVFDTLSSPISGTTIRVDNRPSSHAYTINDTTYSAMTLPYLFFSIVPTETTRVVIYVS
jgi:hypothetical protein